MDEAEEQSGASWAAGLSDEEAVRWAAHRMECLLGIAGCEVERDDKAAAVKAIHQCSGLMVMEDIPVLKLALQHFAASRNAEPMKSLAAFVTKRSGAEACRQMLQEMGEPTS